MIINDLDGYYIVFDTKNWNTELDTLLFKSIRYELRKTGRKQIGQELTSLVYPYSFNYGQLEDGASLNYSENALADGKYLSTNGAF